MAKPSDLIKGEATIFVISIAPGSACNGVIKLKYDGIVAFDLEY